MRIAALAAIAAVCLSVPAHSQRNEVSASAVGNWNPVSYIWIQNNPHEVISSNRSSVGGGASYQRWAFDHCAFGVQFEENPSSGKLFWNGVYFRWRQMRYEIAAMSSQQIAARNLSIFIREGAGSIITNGYSNSGWSHDVAVLEGFGVDYHLTPRFALRAGMTILESQTGCYNDKTCRPTWAAVEDTALGGVWRW